MFVESSPAAEDGVVLQSRSGLTLSATVGAGPIRGVFSQPGVFGGDTFCVSGSTVYRGSTSVGSIAGTGPVSFAAGGASELVICAGGALRLYNGATLSTVAFPDSANVRKIIFHDGLYIAARDGGHRYYWSAVLDGSSWDALDFASAESKPDALLDIDVLNDMLYLFGEETIEAWANTGVADAPYQRQELSILAKGVRATGCIVQMDQAISFVSNENMAYTMRGGAPERISDHGIEEQIAASDSVSCFGYIQDGHSFFCIRLDAVTYAYDLATQQWAELASYGHDNFRVQCATAPGDDAIFGDDTDGKLWTLGGHTDGTDPVERLFTFAMPMNGGSLPIDSLSIWANVGWTELLAGQGSDPIAEMRTSRDAGATFGSWRSAPLGVQGSYRTRTVWRRCGMFDSPGMLGEVRVTEPIGFRLSGVFVNEAGGGRSR
jgi:hypothetical protein